MIKKIKCFLFGHKYKIMFHQNPKLWKCETCNKKKVEIIEKDILF